LQYNPNRVEHKLPILTAIETSNSYENILSEDMKVKAVSVIQIAVLDKYARTGKQIEGGCDYRTAEQIYLDTEAMLIKAVQYLKNVIVAFNTTTLEVQYMHKDLYDLLKTSEQLSSDWVIDKQRSRHFTTMIRRRNPNAQGQRFMGGKNELHGTFLTLSFDF